MSNDGTMIEMMMGATAAFYLIIGLFFIRFWRSTHDRFFLFFAFCFLMEAANRIMLGLFFDFREASPLYYVIRLFSYSFIVIAILDKNKRSKVEK
jgi:hypothetical protein